MIALKYLKTTIKYQTLIYGNFNQETKVITPTPIKKRFIRYNTIKPLSSVVIAVDFFSMEFYQVYNIKSNDEI